MMQLLKWAEPRCWLNWLTDPQERVTAVLMRLWPQADWLTLPEGVSLTSELLLVLMMLMWLQKWERLSVLPQGLPNLLLYLLRVGPDKLTKVPLHRSELCHWFGLRPLRQTTPHPSSSPQCRPIPLSALQLDRRLNPEYLHW